LGLYLNRYFSNDEIFKLFKLDDPSKSETFHQIETLHGHQLNLTPFDSQHRDQMRAFSNCYNVTDHSLLFTYEKQEENIEDDEVQFVAQEVNQARQKMQMETQAISKDVYFRPFTLNVPNLAKKDSPIEKVECEVLEYPTIDIDEQMISSSSSSQSSSQTYVSFSQVHDSDIESIEFELSQERVNSNSGSVLICDTPVKAARSQIVLSDEDDFCVDENDTTERVSTSTPTSKNKKVPISRSFANSRLSSIQPPQESCILLDNSIHLNPILSPFVTQRKQPKSIRHELEDIYKTC